MTKTLRNVINQPLFLSTVCLYLKKTGMKAVVKKKHPLLSVKHCKSHLNFAHAHKDWTVKDWKRVIWSDETKINCLRSDRYKWVWKMPDEGLNNRLIEGTVKFEEGLMMIWGCITWHRVGYVVKIDGRIDGNLYLQILKDELLNTI